VFKKIEYPGKEKRRAAEKSQKRSRQKGGSRQIKEKNATVWEPKMVKQKGESDRGKTADAGKGSSKPCL